MKIHSFGDLISIKKGRKPLRLVSTAADGAVPYATTDYFRKGASVQYVPINELSTCITIQSGCSVLIWDGSNAGEVFLGTGGVLASTMALIKPVHTNLLPIFSYYFLKTAFETLNGGTTGSTIPHVNKNALETLPILVPSVIEQRKIGAILQKVEQAIAILARLKKVSNELKTNVMTQLFTRGLRGEPQKETEIGLMPDSWDVVQLGTLGKIGNGSTPKKTTPEYWVGGTYPWLTSAKVYDREITSADQFVTGVALAECHLPRVKPGAVLMAITGQGKTLGHCAVLNIESSVSQHVAYLQTDTSKADPSFIRGYLETQYEYLRQVASGGGSTKGALTCAFLKSLPVPLPELSEQREIVTVLDAIDQKIALHQQKKSVLDALFRSLLHKLMTGEISVEALDLSALTLKEPQPHTEAEAPS